MVVGHFHQATKRSPREQPNSHRLTVLLHGNSVNTPLRYVGDVTVVLRRCNMGPTPTKSLVHDHAAFLEIARCESALHP
jgi:hypothetical protein